MNKNRAPILVIFRPLWKRILSAPVALKIVGLTITPVAVNLLAAWIYFELYFIRMLEETANATLDPKTLLNLTSRGFVIVGVGTLFGLVISFLLIWQIIRQLSSLVTAMRQVQEGNLGVKVLVWAEDEIGVVQATFNSMVHGLRASRESLLQNQEKLEYLYAERASLLVELTKNEGELRGALRRAVDYQEEERKRISRELHDEIGQALTSILIRRKSLHNVTDLDVIADRINGIRYLTSQTIEEMRRLFMDLRPAALDNLGIIPALSWYIQQSTEQNEIEIQFIAPERMERLPPEVEIVLYRVAQEGLNNAIRHSQAKRIEVKLEHLPRFVWLSVSDDGQGFDADTLHRGLGLVGMVLIATVASLWPSISAARKTVSDILRYQ